VADVTYQLKLKTSRAVFSEIQKKAGPFPFNIRSLEDEKKARVGIHEAEQHNLLRPYEVQQSPSGTFVAAFHFTIALPPTGPILVTHAPLWYDAEKVKSEKELQDPALRELLSKVMREPKKKNNKKGQESKAPAKTVD